MKNCKIKKALLILLALVVVLSFGACKKEAEEITDPEEVFWKPVDTYFSYVGMKAGEISDQHNIWDYEGSIGHQMYFRGLYGEYYVFDAADLSGTTILSDSVCQAVVSEVKFFFPDMTDTMSAEEFYDFIEPPAPLELKYNDTNKSYYYYIETFHGNLTVYVSGSDGDVAPDDLLYVTR